IKAIREDYLHPFLRRAPEAGFASKDKVDAIRALADSLFQAMADGRSVLLTLDFRPAGAALHVELNVAAETKTNTVLKAFKPDPLAALKTLPGNYSQFSAWEFGPEAYRSLQPIMKGALAVSAGGDEDENEDAARAIREALADLVAAKPFCHLTASQPNGLEQLHVWDFGDP